MPVFSGTLIKDSPQALEVGEVRGEVTCSQKTLSLWEDPPKPTHAFKKAVEGIDCKAVQEKPWDGDFYL
jgi:hypothetical protein